MKDRETGKFGIKRVDKDQITNTQNYEADVSSISPSSEWMTSVL